MSSRLFLVTVLSTVFLTGCGRKDPGTMTDAGSGPPAVPDPSAVSQPAVPDPSAVPGPAVPDPFGVPDPYPVSQTAVGGQPAAPQPSKVRLPEVSPELEACAVRVQVNIASTLKRNFPGVILHREAFDPPLPAESTQRMVAVLIPGGDEQTLRDKSCVIEVQRNKTDPQGGKCYSVFKGLLAHFDPATNIALIQYAEDFASRMDVGLRPTTKTDKVVVMDFSRTSMDLGRQGRSKIIQYLGTGSDRLSVYAYYENPVSAVLRDAVLAGKHITLKKLEEGEPAVSDQVVVLGTDRGVAGFATRDAEEKWNYAPLSIPRVTVQRATYVPKSLQFSRRSYENVMFNLQGTLTDPFEEISGYKIRLQTLDSPEFTPTTNPEMDQPPIAATKESGHDYGGGSEPILIVLPLPQGSDTAHYLVQIGLTKKGGTPLFHAAPFLVSFTIRGLSVYPTVRGLPGSAEEPKKPVVASAPEATGEMKEFTTEGPILYGVPIREGREVLFRLAEAPFWKRLSLESREWLPLPKTEMSTAVFAGNKEAIFLLQPASREITRFNAANLAQEATAALPPGISFRDMATGALSAHAPIALIADKGVLACDPHSLAHGMLPASDGSQNLDGLHFLASGDGRFLLGYPMREHESNWPRQTASYKGELPGFGKPNYDTFEQSGVPTVAKSFSWKDGSILYKMPNGDTAKFSPKAGANSSRSFVKGALSTSPIFFSMIGPEADKLPPEPAHAALYSYFDKEPFFEFSMPEFADLSSTERESASLRTWFDPYSMSLAFWHHARTITIHRFDKAKLPAPAKPVLLNFPDAMVARGAVFEYTPLIWGPEGAELIPTNAPAGFENPGKEKGPMRWAVPKDMLSTECHLDFKLSSPGAEPAPASEFRFSLTFGGIQPIAAVAPESDTRIASEAIRVLSGKGGFQGMVPLETRYHVSSLAIKQVLAGLDEYLLLKMEDKSLQLFSTVDWKVVGSLRLPDTSTAFPAGDCLLVYDSTNETVSRMGPPDFRLMANLSIPGNTELIGLGAGEAPDSPVTILLRQTMDPQQQIRAGGIAIPRNILTVVGKDNLKPGKWAQFTEQRKVAKPRTPPLPNQGSKILELESYHGPTHLPTSRDGRLVLLPCGQIIISPTLTTDHVFDSGTAIYHGNMISDESRSPMVCSPTGHRLYANGLYIMDNRVNTSVDQYNKPSAMSRCGNYVVNLVGENDQKILMIQATDGLRPLLKLPVVPLFTVEDGRGGYGQWRLTPVGEKNLIVLLNPGETVMQIIHLDLPAVMKKLAPGTLMTTSSPAPVVAQGRKLEYQVTVNNPDAVKRYRLRDNIPGAGIDDKGLFIYRAPLQMDRPLQFIVGVEIELKNGTIVLHQFPVYVIPISPRPPGQTLPGSKI